MRFDESETYQQKPKKKKSKKKHKNFSTEESFHQSSIGEAEHMPHLSIKSKHSPHYNSGNINYTSPNNNTNNSSINRTNINANNSGDKYRDRSGSGQDDINYYNPRKSTDVKRRSMGGSTGDKNDHLTDIRNKINNNPNNNTNNNSNINSNINNNNTTEKGNLKKGDKKLSKTTVTADLANSTEKGNVIDDKRLSLPRAPDDKKSDVKIEMKDVKKESHRDISINITPAPDDTRTTQKDDNITPRKIDYSESN